MAAIQAGPRVPADRRVLALVAMLGLACLAVCVVDLTLGTSEITLFLPLGVSLVAVGSVLVLRLGRNPIGWLLLAWGVEVTYGLSVAIWAKHTVVTGTAVGPVQRWMSWTMPVLWHPGFILFILAMLLFPDGRLLSRRWTVVTGVAVAIATALGLSAALAPRSTMADYTPGVPAPFVSPTEGWASDAFQGLLGCIPIAVLAGVVSLVVRWRRVTGDDRRQITAFVLPTSVALVLFALSIAIIGDGRLGFVLLPVLPISLAVAVTRYKLYELDRIVSRTTAYALVTAVIAGVYVGAVQLVGLLLPHAGGVDVATATLAAFALFTPVRRRVQRLVDRRFNRNRYDGERLVEAFRARLRAPDEVLDVETDLLAVIDRALHPATASLWIRG